MILFWILTCITGLNAFTNFILMFASEQGKDRGLNAFGFLFNCFLLAYLIFLSTPKV
jgi:hypothetical protein